MISGSSYSFACFESDGESIRLMFTGTSPLIQITNIDWCLNAEFDGMDLDCFKEEPICSDKFAVIVPTQF